MDQSLDEILAAKRRTDRPRGPRGGGGGGRRRGGDRRDDYPRDGVRKSTRDEPRRLDDEWVHDRFEDNGYRRSRTPRGRQDAPEQSYESRGTRIRVDNIHYELTEEDLTRLFEGIGPVTKLELLYDRAGRSEGTAYVTYETYEDGKQAVKEFDGANAKGQPIRLTIMPSGPAPRARNAFDTAVKPGRSLADRITRPRSASPSRDRDDEPRNRGDRYVPGRNGSRSHSPPRRREGGRRPGDRRGGGGRGQRGSGPRPGREGRPRKTQDELDADMANYFTGNASGEPAADAPQSAAPRPQEEDDIDMI